MLANTIYGCKTPFELIIADDGSHDECIDYLMDLYQKKLVSTLILNVGENMGVGEGMRRCFGVAQGEYLVKADADLLYKPGWLDEGVRMMNRFPQVSCLGFFHYYHDPVDCRKMFVERLEMDGISVEICKDFVSSAFMTRSELFKKYGMEHYSEAFAEDFMFKMKLKESGYKLGLTPEDWIVNFGFGLGKSIVVNPDMSVRKIAKKPLILGGGKC